MPSVAPPVAPAPPAPAPGAAPQPAVIVPEAPPALAQLALGARLDATVASIQGQGVYQLQTALGTLSAQTAYPLPRDAVLVLLLQALSPQTRLLIASVNGTVTGRGTGDGGALPGPPAATAPSAAPLAAATPLSLTVGATVTATLVRPPSAGAASPAGAPAPGTAVAAGSLATGFRLPAAAAPGTGLPIGLPKAAVTTLTQATFQAAAPGATAVPHPAGPAPARAGLQFPVTIVALRPGAAAATTSPPASGTLAAGQVLHGTVTGTSPLGHALVQTAAGLLSLATRTPPPAGSAITLEVAGPPAMTGAARQTLTLLPHAELLNARDWPLLDEALRALGEANPAIAQKVAETAIPRANARLGASVLFFLSALRAGDLRNWLGIEPVRILQRFRPDLMAQLQDDFGRLSRQAQEPVSADWRFALIPLQTEGAIERIRLFMRNHGGEDGDEARGNGGLRFVVDVSLSRIGRLQLDGLVRAKGKRLDLIVRTALPMPGNMHNDIRRIFDEANDLTGIVGGLSFQAAPPDFVEITADAPSQAPRPSLVV